MPSPAKAPSEAVIQAVLKSTTPNPIKVPSPTNNAAPGKRIPTIIVILQERQEI